MEFIKPGISIDFMRVARRFVIGSTIAVTLSLIVIFTIGFESGIDFKGGTKIIAEFKANENIDRDHIKASVDELVQANTSVKDSQVEVQDFDVGSGGSSDTVKFQIFTELPSLLSPTDKLEMANTITKHFGKGTIVESPFEAGDKFYLYLKDAWPRKAAREEIQKVFTATGHEHISVISDKEERIRASGKGPASFLN